MDSQKRINIQRKKAKLKSGTVEYHYAWRNGPRFWSSQEADSCAEGSRAYWNRYRKLVENLPENRNIFRRIIRAFLASPRYERLSERTKKNLSHSISRPNGIDAKWGTAPIALFDHPMVRREVYKWRDRCFASDRSADCVVGDLVSIVSWAKDRGELGFNHLERMERRYSNSRAHLMWTDAEIETFLTGEAGELRLLPPADPVDARIMIMATQTGLAPVDLIRVTRGHLRWVNGRRIIQIVRSKTRKTNSMASIPVLPRLATLLDETPSDQMVYLVGAKGHPFRKSHTISKRVRARRDRLAEAAAKLGLPPPIRPELNFYDTRSTAAYRLYEAGADLHELAGAMGWLPQTAAQMLATYTKSEGAHVVGLFDKLSKLNSEGST